MNEPEFQYRMVRADGLVGGCTLRDALGTLESTKMRMSFEQYGLFGEGEEG